MSHTATRNLLRDALAERFDEGAFRRFVQNALDGAELLDEPNRTGNYVRHAFHGHVTSFKRIAKYKDPEGDWFDVLAVKLEKGSMLDRARTMQRNFAADYLRGRTGRMPEAALVAYHADDVLDWRLSLVRIEYRAEETEDGRVKAKEVLSPARRYSFLVGEGEPSHTAQQQLHALLDADEPPTVDAIEEAFSIERVTNDFFDAYKELFLALKEDLDDARENDPRVDAELTRCNLTTHGFAKKLLGQLVFLYFLQKKGWLGVARDDKWGDGPKNFLRRLFEREYGDYDNFFEDCLEPLFYEALATERGADGYYNAFDCRIPFLNGGLFEPPGGYAWDGVPLHIPDRTFRQVFDTFDRYNFTVREDEPLEKEVAVDPEMLGKVFENLLEVRERKSKGAFYTPREIVSYMCNESLIQYLEEKLSPGPDPGAGVPKADLEALVQEGERWIENDLKVIAAGQETETYSFAAPAPIREHAAAIDAALRDITVCDPAIGSGAFPVGMMQAVVRVREGLTPYLHAEQRRSVVEADGQAERSAYAFKRHAIQHSLYGVDIEPSAVDIARLRLWLSLVVDEDDYRTIQPLPNLRYKIVEGDSLGGIEHSLENNEAYDRLQQLIPRHVEASSPTRKERLQREIDELIQQVTEGVFDFHLYFGNVFHANGGFDVMIANPPYVRQEKLSRDQKESYKKQFKSYHGVADLYVYFLEQGVRLLRPNGVLTYITSNSYLNSGFAAKLRGFLTTNTNLERLIDFAETPIFEAVTEPAVLIARHRAPAQNNEVRMLKWDEKEPLGTLRTIPETAFVTRRQSELDENYWQLERPEVMALLGKLRNAGTPLGEYVDGEIYRGVLTGLNKAFVIDTKTREKLIEEDPRSAEVIKPFLSGRDIKRYRPPVAKKYVIVLPSGWTNEHSNGAPDKWEWLQQQLPAIAKHLEPFSEAAEKRWDQGDYWWELRPCDYYEAFEEPKIVYPVINRTDSYTYDENGFYGNDKVYIIPGASSHLVGLMNSSVVTFFNHIHTGVPIGGFFETRSPIIKAIPVPDLSSAQQQRIEQRVRELLRLHKQSSNGADQKIERLKREIDRLFHDAFGLTEEEVGVVESAVA